MTGSLHLAIRTLEQELEVLDQRRGELQKAIDTLQGLAGDQTPARQSPAHRRRRSRTAARPATRGPRAASAADGPIATAKTRILAQLQTRQGWSLKDLSAATRVTPYALRQALTQLARAKAVVIVGRGRGQRVSRPGKAPKEGL